MSQLSIDSMRTFLSQSISSLNRNKINGMLAEIDFRNRLTELGFGERVSQGGWIVRSTGENNFSEYVNVLFPMTIQPGTEYRPDNFNEPPRRLHTICATMHQIGIHSYFCRPTIETDNDPDSINWFATQLGIPGEDENHRLNDIGVGFQIRQRRYNFLRYQQNTGIIPDEFIPAEFTKEHLRVRFQENFLCEISDIDGIFWGQQYTYPLEIKEKTVAEDNKLGEYFGIDIGPFVKLAFYAARRGNLHSIFVVREIDNTNDRNLLNWWFIPFNQLAQYASWIPVGGGRNMQGGNSSVVKIPRNEFTIMDATSLKRL